MFCLCLGPKPFLSFKNIYKKNCKRNTLRPAAGCCHLIFLDFYTNSFRTNISYQSTFLIILLKCKVYIFYLICQKDKLWFCYQSSIQSTHLRNQVFTIHFVFSSDKRPRIFPGMKKEDKKTKTFLGCMKLNTCI